MEQNSAVSMTLRQLNGSRFSCNFQEIPNFQQAKILNFVNFTIYLAFLSCALNIKQICVLYIKVTLPCIYFNLLA